MTQPHRANYVIWFQKLHKQVNFVVTKKLCDLETRFNTFSFHNSTRVWRSFHCRLNYVIVDFYVLNYSLQGCLKPTMTWRLASFGKLVFFFDAPSLLVKWNSRGRVTEERMLLRSTL